jgi:hypothetical protein
VAYVGAVGDELLDDFAMAVGGGGKQWRVARAVAVIDVGAFFQKPFHNFGVAAGDGAGERVVASAIGGGSVYVRAFFREIGGNVEMTEDGSESDYRETIWGKGIRESGIFFDELSYAIDTSGGCGVVNLELRAMEHEEIADFAVAPIDGSENGRETGIVFGGSQVGIDFQQSFDARVVASLNGVEESRGGTHELYPPERIDDQRERAGAYSETARRTINAANDPCEQPRR